MAGAGAYASRVVRAVAAAALFGRSFTGGAEVPAVPQAAPPPAEPPVTVVSGTPGAQAPSATAPAANAVAAPAGNCWNPMFAMHWAGKSDIRHLEASPTVQSGLRRCVAYNSKSACCPASFERTLQEAFDRWAEHLRRTIQGAKTFHVQLTGIKLSDAYVGAVPEEKALLNKALDTFPEIMDTFGDCFDTVLEYLAGVLCFSCDPQWRQRVLLDAGGRKVTHILVDDRDYDMLWDQCKALAAATVKAEERIADASLAKLAQAPFPDLRLFATKAAVAEFAVSAGLRALRGPNEQELKVRPQDNTGRRLVQPATSPAAAAAASGANAASAPLRPVYDGRNSGFQCTVFPRSLSALGAADPSAASARVPATALLLGISAAVVAAIVGAA
eukprot:TRINITY_DN6159_c0_g1_i1.p1 TRINITY_DN6159_c0_g1~~TRINITY_DN6159_c0_g1_i1.p1  ORF type:complete len:387 (+),score=91.43 TRINITY_DN6159_c0_g1_i1:178-1338(+)